MKGILLESMDVLAEKKKDYEDAMEHTDISLLRLLYADSASVIGDCIEVISGIIRKYGIPLA
jgi:hypothetical protein